MLLNIVVNMTLYKCYYVCILKVVSLVPFSLNVGARADKGESDDGGDDDRCFLFLPECG